jgi:hypothetical protein
MWSAGQDAIGHSKAYRTLRKGGGRMQDLKIHSGTTVDRPHALAYLRSTTAEMNDVHCCMKPIQIVFWARGCRDLSVAQVSQ